MNDTVTRLNKAAIINGTAQVHYEFVEELNGELALAPLTEGQYSQIEAIKGSGIKMKGRPVMDKDGNPDFEKISENLEMEMDLENMTRNDFEAEVLAVAYSLSGGTGEHWTVDDVKSIRPPGIVSRLAKVVFKISGVSPAQIEQVRSFREKSGRAGNRKSAPKRSAAGK